MSLFFQFQNGKHSAISNLHPYINHHAYLSLCLSSCVCLDWEYHQVDSFRGPSKHCYSNYIPTKQVLLGMYYVTQSAQTNLSKILKKHHQDIHRIKVQASGVQNMTCEKSQIKQHRVHQLGSLTNQANMDRIGKVSQLVDSMH